MGELRQHQPGHAVALFESNCCWRFAIQQGAPCVNRSEQCEDCAFLVEVQLSEPPEAVARIGEPLAKAQAINPREPDGLDPFVCLARRAFLSLRVEIVRQADSPRSRA
jgi:hypothetical protein